MPITTAVQAHVDGGLARAVGNLILHYDAPPAAFISLRDAICAAHGYQDEIDGIPNPQTKAEFSEAWIKGVLKGTERGVRIRQAGIDASEAEGQNPDVDVE